MLCLVIGYIVSDFSIENVFLNSHQAKPLLYKITGSWGNHEGSMLLLNAILGCYAVAFAFRPAKHQQTILNVFHLVFAGLIAFSLFLSNPFETLNPVPSTGQGLNPLLQDIGLAIHPPLLYMGYVGFSLVFASAIVHIYHHSIDKEWASHIKPWVFFSWGFLTFGIAMGSWWAYRELGWGGFWFWDPVENASLLPWLSATALVHSLIVLEKRQHLPHWTALLSIITFALCLVGIFLVRSGILTSVHSFALDPERGIYFLILLAILLLGSLTVLALKTGKLYTQKTQPFTFLSKETSLLLNNIFLTVLCFTVLLGILYPIIIEVLYQTTISVGGGFYNKSFNSISFPLLGLLCIAPYLQWKQDKKIRTHLLSLLPTIIITTAIALWLQTQSINLMAMIGICLGSAITISTLTWAWKQTSSLKSWKSKPLSFHRMVIGHIGLGILVLSISGNSAFKHEKDFVFTMGQTHTLPGFSLTLKNMFLDTGDNYYTRSGVFELYNQNDQQLATLYPEVRYYVAEQQNTTESDIYYGWGYNFYIAMGDVKDAKEFAVRVYYQPLMNFLWLGCLLIALSGILGVRKK
jgi:cytochrome c-type biogenesis protein CcmF